MFAIRKEQEAVLGAAAREHFENEMMAHCQKFSPPLCATLEEPQLRLAIQYAIENAERYGLTTQGPVRLYIEMAMLFGSDFDSDPQYPWAKEILTNKELFIQSEKADQLFAKTLEYLDLVVGDDDVHTLKALERISVYAQMTPAYSTDQYASSMQDDIAMLYPEKADYIGTTAIGSLIRKGEAKSIQYDMTSANDWVVVTILMFCFGYHCEQDPFYPWIHNTFTDEKITDPEKRIKRLKKKAVTWLDQVIEWQTKGR